MASSVSASSRILNSTLAQRVMSAEEAAALIQSGTRIGMSGFTGSGYPKAVPLALGGWPIQAMFRLEWGIRRA
jgi:acyl-CoA hydrolase